MSLERRPVEHRAVGPSRLGQKRLLPLRPADKCSWAAEIYERAWWLGSGEVTALSGEDFLTNWTQRSVANLLLEVLPAAAEEAWGRRRIGIVGEVPRRRCLPES